ncbi:hypothetical protein V8E36_009607 [Tilletia maclaganii]
MRCASPADRRSCAGCLVGRRGTNNDLLSSFHCPPTSITTRHFLPSTTSHSHHHHHFPSSKMSSKKAQAMPAQDVSPDDAQVLLAAQISIAAASSETDVVKRRQGAINAARKLHPKSSHHSDILQAEMNAIRGMLGSSAKTEGGTDGASRRPASPLAADTQPALKRSRPTPAASHGPSRNEVDSGQHSALIECAVGRFFGVVELVSKVFEHLLYERIDLVSLSKVSKSCRSIALPMLVESLSIAFSKAETFSDLFSSNPGLIAHVKYLRLWDDVAYATSRRRRSDPTQQHTDADWAKLGNLIIQFEGAALSSAPILELSVGQLRLLDVHALFVKAPRLLGQLTSLQVEDDVFPSTAHDDDAKLYHEEAEVFSRFGVQLTERLTLLLYNCFSQQDKADAKLRKFALASSRRWVGSDSQSVFPTFGSHLIQKLTSCLTHLELKIAVGYGDLPPLDDFLNREWPMLDTVNISLLDDTEWDDALSSRMMGCLVRNNAGIRHVCVNVYNEGEDEDSDWCDLAQPNQLVTFCFGGSVALASSEFAKRQTALQDLALHDMDDGWPFAAEAAFIRSLRVLRGPIRAVDTFLSEDNHLREVHVSPNCWDEEWHLERSEDPEYMEHCPTIVHPPDSGIHSSTVTFLSLDLRTLFITEIVQSFPSVIELALIGGDRYHDPKDRSPDLSLAHISSMLARCAPDEGTATPGLRAILLFGDYGVPLAIPSDGHITLDVKLPPRLEYVTWHTSNRAVQHFRVAQHYDAKERKARLQLLPAIFRPKVDRTTGFWENVFDERHGYALFDHLSGDEPRLKYM